MVMDSIPSRWKSLLCIVFLVLSMQWLIISDANSSLVDWAVSELGGALVIALVAYWPYRLMLSLLVGSRPRWFARFYWLFLASAVADFLMVSASGSEPGGVGQVVVPGAAAVTGAWAAARLWE